MNHENLNHKHLAFQPEPQWLPLEIVTAWLEDRASDPTAWLLDCSKYVSMRFDSRTGDVLVGHDTAGTYLGFKGE